jgi:RluA family pseudouridine synthase
LLSELDRFGAPAVESVLARQLGSAERPAKLWLVHRLDAGTSGVLLLARTALAARQLGAAFRDGAVHKTYLALVSGRLRRNVEVDAPIARAQGTRHMVSEKGKAARTAFVPLAHGGGATLVGCTPSTGRTHQIRVHLAHLGHPILGDRLYGGQGYFGETPPEPIARPMLHAYRLQVSHPRTAAALVIEAKAPADFERLGRLLGLWREGAWL